MCKGITNQAAPFKRPENVGGRLGTYGTSH
jgi:hypothetical protein